MRSIKLLVAAALVAAFVAGPVFAQEAETMAPAAEAAAPDAAKPMKHHGKHHAKKKHHKKEMAAPAAQ